MTLNTKQSACSSCISNVGDLALMEYLTIRRRYPLIEVNIMPYLVDAVREYFKEARDRGCVISKELKECIAERIRSFLASYNIDLSRLSFYDLRGTTDEDVLDVLRALGIEVTFNVAPSAHVEQREEADGPGRPHVVANAPETLQYTSQTFSSSGQAHVIVTPKKPQFCAPRTGDFAVLEYLAVRRRNPLVKPNIGSFLAEAILEYFKEAQKSGCDVDYNLKRYVAERIRTLLGKYGVDVTREVAYDLHATNKDILDVIRMLGVRIVARPPADFTGTHTRDETGKAKSGRKQKLRLIVGIALTFFITLLLLILFAKPS